MATDTNELIESELSGTYRLTELSTTVREGEGGGGGEEEGEGEGEENKGGAAGDIEKTVELVYTVEDAIEHIGFGPFQILVTVFSGLIWISDAMEVMLLSVLSPIVTCDWFLEDWEEAMITSVVFIGFFFGALFWGAITDLIGRKRVLLIVSFEIVIFGLASAVAPNYWTLLMFRCLAGFGIAGTDQAITYYTEFLPKRFRGFCLVLLDVWWAIGTVLAALIALAVIPNVPDPIATSDPNYDHINWRIYIALCTLPTGLVTVFFIFVPESARFYISKGDLVKGEKVIASIARINMKTVPSGRLVAQEEKELLARDTPPSTTNTEQQTDTIVQESSFIEEETRGASNDDPTAPLLTTLDDLPTTEGEQENYRKEMTSKLSIIEKKMIKSIVNMFKDISLLFTGGTWRTSLILLILWIGGAWLYYGAILLTTTILEIGYDPHCGNVNRSIIDSGCQNLTTDFYLRIVWTSAAEFPGIIVTLIIIELVGRKITMAIEFFASAVFLALVFICVPKVWLTVFLFCARGFISGVYQTVYVYTPEVYPTRVRGVALGVMTSAARIGALLTPFVAQALFPVSDYSTISLYVGTSLVFALLSLLLPVETKGKSLRDLKGHSNK